MAHSNNPVIHKAGTFILWHRSRDSIKCIQFVANGYISISIADAFIIHAAALNTLGQHEICPLFRTLIYSLYSHFKICFSNVFLNFRIYSRVGGSFARPPLVRPSIRTASSQPTSCQHFRYHMRRNEWFQSFSSMAAHHVFRRLICSRPGIDHFCIFPFCSHLHIRSFSRFVPIAADCVAHACIAAHTRNRWLTLVRECVDECGDGGGGACFMGNKVAVCVTQPNIVKHATPECFKCEWLRRGIPCMQLGRHYVFIIAQTLVHTPPRTNPQHLSVLWCTKKGSTKRQLSHFDRNRLLFSVFGRFVQCSNLEWVNIGLLAAVAGRLAIIRAIMFISVVL